MKAKEIVTILSVFNQREIELKAHAHALMDMGEDTKVQHLNHKIEEVRILRERTIEAIDGNCE